MGFFNTALYTAQDAARANTSRLAAQNTGSGDVQFAYIPYTLVGTETIVSLTSGATTAGSTAISFGSATVTAGMAITGTGIPLGATIVSATSTTAVLSVAATATGSSLTLSAFDVINLCTLPVDAIVIPGLCHVTCLTDPGTALTLNIGSIAAPTGIAASMALTVVGTVYSAIAGGTMPAWLTPTPLVPDATPIPALANSGNVVIRAAITVATSLTASTGMVFCIAYKMPK
jgi:hypothetical protein